MSFGMSMAMKEAYKVVEAIDEQLNGYDFYYTALINHEDGSFLIVKNALVFQWNDYWLVFAEHAPPQAYHKEDASVCQLKEIEIDTVGNNTLPYVRQLIIDDLPVRVYAFATKPEIGKFFWIKEPEHKHRGRTIKVMSADAFMVRGTGNYPKQPMWGPGEKEAWLAKETAKKADPEWELYQRLIKKFKEKDDDELPLQQGE